MEQGGRAGHAKTQCIIEVPCRVVRVTGVRSGTFTLLIDAVLIPSKYAVHDRFLPLHFRCCTGPCYMNLPWDSRAFAAVAFREP
jgi:hypothetical protein